MFKRAVSSAASESRRLLITDPAYIKSSRSYDELIRQCRSDNRFVSVQVHKSLVADIRANRSVDLPWMQDDEYHAFGECGQAKDYHTLGTVTSDSGLWCIVDEDMIRGTDLSIDWQRFAVSTLAAGSSAHRLDDYPMFLWICSSINGDNSCSVSGFIGNDSGGGGGDDGGDDGDDGGDNTDKNGDNTDKNGNNTDKNGDNINDNGNNINDNGSCYRGLLLRAATGRQ